MTTPRGSPELTTGQAVPETTVNEQIRRTEAGACLFPVKDKDLTAPPGSCSDGDSYIIAATATGLWVGKEKQIATAVGANAASGWYYHTPVEGFFAYPQDENTLYRYDGSAWGIYSPAIAEASNAEVWAGSASDRFLSPLRLYSASAPVALTSGATITPDGDNGFNFTLTLAHNATLANPSNFDVGRSGIIVITQDGTGSRTLAYGSNWKFPGGAPVLSTAAGAVDVLAYYVVTSSIIVATLTKAYSS